MSKHDTYGVTRYHNAHAAEHPTYLQVHAPGIGAARQCLPDAAGPRVQLQDAGSGGSVVQCSPSTLQGRKLLPSRKRWMDQRGASRCLRCRPLKRTALSAGGGQRGVHHCAGDRTPAGGLGVRPHQAGSCRHVWCASLTPLHCCWQQHGACVHPAAW